MRGCKYWLAMSPRLGHVMQHSAQGSHRPSLLGAARCSLGAILTTHEGGPVRVEAARACVVHAKSCLSVARRSRPWCFWATGPICVSDGLLHCQPPSTFHLPPSTFPLRHFRCGRGEAGWQVPGRRPGRGRGRKPNQWIYRGIWQGPIWQVLRFNRLVTDLMDLMAVRRLTSRGGLGDDKCHMQAGRVF